MSKLQYIGITHDRAFQVLSLIMTTKELVESWEPESKDKQTEKQESLSMLSELKMYFQQRLGVSDADFERNQETGEGSTKSGE